MGSQAQDKGTVRVGKLPVLLYGLGLGWAAAGSVRLLTSARYLGIVTEGGDVDPAIGQVEVSLASANGVWVVITSMSLIEIPADSSALRAAGTGAFGI